jgi:hypothetical protein
MVDRRGAFAASGCDLPCKNLEILAAAPEKWATGIRLFYEISPLHHISDC